MDYSATVKGSGETENLFRSTVFDAAVRIDLELEQVDGSEHVGALRWCSGQTTLRMKVGISGLRDFVRKWMCSQRAVSETLYENECVVTVRS